MSRASGFRGRWSDGRTTFPCSCCKRRTRMTTQSNDSFCGECEELLMMQNGLWDNGAESFVTDGQPKYRDQFLAKIKKLGGNVEAVKAYMPDLFNPELEKEGTR